MSSSLDLRSYKKSLRSRYREIRKNIEPDARADKDRRILSHILAMPVYRDCRLLLVYVSMDDEADTRALIQQAIADGKSVAVPYCLDTGGQMEFYRINSLEELVPRAFGIFEPVASEESRITSFEDALCILPGLAFDRYGYRLGYGRGYYDRFLSRAFKGRTLGVCYEDCLLEHLRHGPFDIPCGHIVTERGVCEALSGA